MNPTLLNAPRALVAATAALVLALAVAFLTPTIAEELQRDLGNRSASQVTTVDRNDVPPATWAQNPLTSPLQTLRGASPATPGHLAPGN